MRGWKKKDSKDRKYNPTGIFDNVMPTTLSRNLASSTFIDGSLKKTTRRRSEPIISPTGPAAGDAYGPVIGVFAP